jgi:hypothetical protein
LIRRAEEIEKDMSLDLEREVFLFVARRIRSRADSLRALKRFPRSGIEGWLKVQVVAALGSLVKRLQNKGLDLLLASGVEIELRAATDLNIPRLSAGASVAPCLFVGEGSDESRIASFQKHGVDLLAHQFFSDGAEQWVLGLLRPKPKIK